ncbi:hypothetical protein QQF64_018444 [Cirrhinus molitorella]|uniref:Uncharacterized protein n=1 Tax=Cirrhinus molitorella TaxID=172907 RepID=A0ABR3LCR8_9TELE
MARGLAELVYAYNVDTTLLHRLFITICCSAFVPHLPIDALWVQEPMQTRDKTGLNATQGKDIGRLICVQKSMLRKKQLTEWHSKKRGCIVQQSRWGSMCISVIDPQEGTKSKTPWSSTMYKVV